MIWHSDVWGRRSQGTVLTAVGVRNIFVAKYAAIAGADSDRDGLPDDVDFCPATVLPEAVPTSGRLLPNRFAITDQGRRSRPGRSAPADT